MRDVKLLQSPYPISWLLLFLLLPLLLRTQGLYVDITYLSSAVSKGAVCLDGSPPTYHLSRGFGSGVNNWLVHIEGGGWCNNVTTCLARKYTRLGSSKQMAKQVAFSGILSNRQSFNPELELYEEEDEYLARAVFDHMHLSDDQVCNNNKVRCPICKQGELREALHLIYCTCCKLRLDLQNDKVNLDLLRNRLGGVHGEHFDRGCKATPKFSMETIFHLTALCIQCKVCVTFEIVL